MIIPKSPNPTQPENTKIPCKIGSLRVAAEDGDDCDSDANEPEIPPEDIGERESDEDNVLLLSAVGTLESVSAVVTANDEPEDSDFEAL